MAVVKLPPMTVEEFSKLPDPDDGSRLELVRGVVLALPSSQAKHGLCCSRVGRKLGNYVDDNKRGWVASNDTGVVLERGSDTLRGPDVAFWSIERQPSEPDGYFEIPPDIAVEVVSPSDRKKDIRAKIKEYVFFGVRLIWLVDPDARTVTVYAGSLRGTELDESDTLDGGDVLSGFSCKLADFFV